VTPQESIQAVIDHATLLRQDYGKVGNTYSIDYINGFEDAAGMLEEQASDDPVWIETTMTNCLINDRIRIGQEETTVLRSSHGLWHATNAWAPARWDHIELRMELEAVPGFKQYPPAASIEILCAPDRLAVLRLQEAFPGSQITSSHVH
jgi:hypothetical protein